MKSYLSSIDIASLVYELKPELEGAWINNIYQLNKTLFVLKLRSKNGNLFLVIEAGKRFNLSEFKRKMPDSPPKFCQTLRTHLKDKLITNIYQVETDRVVVFEITIGDLAPYKLVVELFGKGNMILVNPQNKIISAISYQKFGVRDVHPGKDFGLPPKPDYSLFTIQEDIMSKALSDYTGSLVILLNSWLGLGPLYSKEILLRASIPRKIDQPLTVEDKDSLISEIMNFKEVIENGAYQPSVFFDVEDTSTLSDEMMLEDFESLINSGQLVDISPVSMLLQENKGLTTQRFESFNYLIDIYFRVLEDLDTFETEQVSKKRTNISKLERIISDQETHVERFRKESAINRKKGDVCYAHFHDLDELLSTIITARRNNVTWDLIEEKLALAKEKNIPSGKIYNSVNKKTAAVKVELPDLESDDIYNLGLDIRLSIADNANLFYEKAKKSERKEERALVSIEHNKTKLGSMIQDADTIEETIEKESLSPLIKQRKKLWYEHFYWFNTSNGHLVIGGTDATTNERLIRRYLEEEDLFFHADIHGAPSVIMKGDGQEPTEDELLEIASFATSYSSAWRSKYVVADAYYVGPDQVSLSAPSGQYIPKGGVMIYGTRNYVRNCPLQIALGVVVTNNLPQLMVGPELAIKEHTQYYVVIRPGDNTRGQLAKKIHSLLLEQTSEYPHFSVHLTIDDVTRFLPGDSEIVR